jgi:hypothetical protein
MDHVHAIGIIPTMLFFYTAETDILRAIPMPSINAMAIDPMLIPTTKGVEILFFDWEFFVMTDVLLLLLLLLLPVVMGVVTVDVLLLFVVLLATVAGAIVDGAGTGTDVVVTGEGIIVLGASVVTTGDGVVITGMDMDKLIIMENDVSCSNRRVPYSFRSNVSINNRASSSTNNRVRRFCCCGSLCCCCSMFMIATVVRRRRKRERLQACTCGMVMAHVSAAVVIIMARTCDGEEIIMVLREFVLFVFVWCLVLRSLFVFVRKTFNGQSAIW